MSLPAAVATARLSLDLITPEVAARMRAGERLPHWHPNYPRADDVDAAAMATGDGWGARAITRAGDGVVFGSIGFFGPPAPGADAVDEVEIGFGLVAEARGRGVATEAVRALLAYADRAGVRVRAAVAPDNAASVRVLAKCGFTQLRGATEDGELVMVRPVPGWVS